MFSCAMRVAHEGQGTKDDVSYYSNKSRKLGTGMRQSVWPTGRRRVIDSSNRPNCELTVSSSSFDWREPEAPQTSAMTDER